MSPLSWSVAKVCSSRPSEPKTSQHQGTAGRSNSSSMISMTRMAIRSLSPDIHWQSASTPMPAWNSSAPRRRT